MTEGQGGGDGGNGYPPIGDYGLLSDCHGAALVSRGGSIDWCCLLRVDAHPVFGRLLNRDDGGHFSISPISSHEPSRRYLPRTNVLETTFECEGGRVVVTDAMAVERGKNALPDSERRGSRNVHQTTGGSGAGSGALHEDDPVPYGQILRRVRCEAGSVRLRVEFRPRFNFGLTVPRLVPGREGVVLAYGGSGGVALQSPTRLEIDDDCASGVLELEEGAEVWLAVSAIDPHAEDLSQPRFEPLEASELERRLDATASFWEEWTSRCRYDGPYREEVERSALVLKALRFVPTGAVLAAPTTSLPEVIGGDRNWDYRYSWVRDAAFAIDALMELGYEREASEWMHWLQLATAGRPENLQPMFAVDGARVLSEIELEQVDGYRGSSPVRVGNKAYSQFQLDAPGEAVEALWHYARHGGDLTEAMWDFIQAAVAQVAEQWERPDAGLWESRGGPWNFTHSKVMAWAAVERAIRLVEEHGWETRADVAEWKELRDRIRARVEEAGVDAQGRFTRSFGIDAPDAALLLLPLLGFVEHDDERASATRDWIWDRLGRGEGGTLVRRYDVDDGLDGEEGAFVACSFWLAENLARAGQSTEAQRVFEAVCSRANDLGLLSEEMDPETGELLGNFPQALSHIALISAALAMEDEETAY